jgi:RNA polymerase sigma-70 factor, ECF subfamily
MVAAADADDKAGRRARGGGGDEFGDALAALLPRLRAQAWALTRERAAAEDLVQDAVAGALAGRASFAAWVHRILHNRFLDTHRRRQRGRTAISIDDVSEREVAVGAAAAHEERLVLGELRRALARLPAAQREALVMVALDGMDYDAVAAATRTAVGTAKSRVYRARQHLQAELRGGISEDRSRMERFAPVAV